MPNELMGLINQAQRQLDCYELEDILACRSAIRRMHDAISGNPDELWIAGGNPSTFLESRLVAMINYHEPQHVDLLVSWTKKCFGMDMADIRDQFDDGGYASKIREDLI